jgi:hypothetical protein
MTVKLSATAPDGFIAFSHCGDDWRDVRDHIREQLGIPTDNWKRERPDDASKACSEPAAPPDDSTRIASAMSRWRASVPRGTHVERYLASRGLELGDDLAGEVIRFHPGVNAMVALFRDVRTDEPRAVSRTFLDQDARKIERKFLGPTRNSAVKLDGDDTVLGGLFIGEGVETCLAARQVGLKPCWALGSAGAIATFAVLPAIEALSVIVDHDPNGAGEKAARAAEAHWRAAGREVNLLRSDAPGDFNDLHRGAA